MRKGTNEEEVFHCSCCGMVAPVTRLTEDSPVEFRQTTKRWGGSRPLTDEELEKRFKYGRGTAPGILIIEKPWREPDPDVREAYIARLREVLSILTGEE